MASLPNSKGELGLAGRVARAFIDSKLTPLILLRRNVFFRQQMFDAESRGDSDS